MKSMVIRVLLQGLLAVSIIAAGIVVGAQLRESREQLATGQAGSAATNQPSVAPTVAPVVTPAPTPSQPPAVRTVVPTPIRTPFTGVKTLLMGTVMMGGAPVRGAQVMVYYNPANPAESALER